MNAQFTLRAALYTWLKRLRAAYRIACLRLPVGFCLLPPAPLGSLCITRRRRCLWFNSSRCASSGFANYGFLAPAARLQQFPNQLIPNALRALPHGLDYMPGLI